MKAIAVIPARLASTRLSRKALQDLPEGEQVLSAFPIDLVYDRPAATSNR
jgi:CMP-2-keto-3-deoxyoctulosonic acid synthetase